MENSLHPNEETSTPSLLLPPTPPPAKEKGRFFDKRRNALTAAIAVIAAAGLLALFYPYVVFIMRILFPICLLERTTGLHCVLCGATRSVICLLQFNLRGAIYYNPVIPVFCLWFAYEYVRLWISALRRNYTPYRIKYKMWQVFSVLALLGVFMIVRNFSFYRSVMF
jgi:hypothetical protein